jgi:hypothetical protein
MAVLTDLIAEEGHLPRSEGVMVGPKVAVEGVASRAPRGMPIPADGLDPRVQLCLAERTYDRGCRLTDHGTHAASRSTRAHGSRDRIARCHD